MVTKNKMTLAKAQEILCAHRGEVWRLRYKLPKREGIGYVTVQSILDVINGRKKSARIEMVAIARAEEIQAQEAAESAGKQLVA